MSRPFEVVTAPDAEAAAGEIARRFAEALAARDAEWHLAVSGGSVATSVVPSMVEATNAAGLDWSRVHVWFADERFVPRGHDDRNAVPIVEALRDAAGFDHANLHAPLSSDLGVGCDEAALAYERELRGAVASIDLVLLGAGPDGHTASLFPGHPLVTDPEPGRLVAALDDSPKPPPARVTLTLEAIRSAARVWAVVTGASKAEAVARALDDGTGADASASPLGASLRSASGGASEGRLLVLDRDAAGDPQRG